MPHKRDKTIAALAELLGVSTAAVNLWISAGCPHDKRKGRNYFNEGEVEAWRAKQPNPGRPRNPGTTGSTTGAAEPSSKLHKINEAIRAQILRKYNRENNVDEAKLHDVAKCEKDKQEFDGLLANALENFITNLPPRLVGRDEPSMMVVLRRAVDDLLRTMSGDPPDPPDPPDPREAPKAPAREGDHRDALPET